MKYLEQNEQDNLEQIILILTSKYNIECIYMNTHDNNTSYELIILVSNKYLKTLGELVPKIVNSIKAFEQYRIMCYIAFQAKDKIREGNLYLFTACQPDKLVYRKEESAFVPIPDDFNSKKCLDLVIALRSREQQKIDEFRDGYYHFKEQGKYPLASFMLHQTIELTYRYLELLLTAKGRITHSIRCHHRYLHEKCSYNPNIFDEEKDTDIYLLQVLEDVYRATRYEDNFQVDIETLLQLETKMEAVLLNATELFDTVVFSFEQHHIQDTNVLDQEKSSLNSTPNLQFQFKEDSTLKDVLDLIKSKIEVDINVYLFGWRKRSFEMQGIGLKDDKTEMLDLYSDLLIVSESDIREEVGNLHASINQKTGISVLLLSFTQEQVQKQLDNNNPFFHQVLQYTEPLVHTENYSLSWNFHENNGIRAEKGQDKAKTNWYDRESNSSGFYNGGHGIDNSEEVAIKVLLYNQAIEQACLGLLEYFYGYTPYLYNLKHLYSLCSSFWKFPNDIFPRSTEEEKLLFKEFVQTVKDARYKGRSSVDWDEAYRYDDRCERFLEQCSKLVRG